MTEETYLLVVTEGQHIMNARVEIWPMFSRFNDVDGGQSYPEKPSITGKRAVFNCVTCI